MSLFALALASLPLSQTALADIARAEEERLATCLELTETAPEAAYEDSLAWLGNGNRPRARYCNAMALLALENYEEGAARLEALATAPDPISLENRALYMMKAGNAWLTAGYPDAAIVALSEALKLKTDSHELYKDRASAFLAAERWYEGLDDLDRALSLVPGDVEALELRARAYLAMEDLQRAQADLQAALAQTPENIDLLVLRGDIREAIRLKAER